MIFRLNADQRKTEKKSDLNKLRKDGFIPAIVYGPGTEPLKITLEKAEFMKLYKKSFNELVFYEIKLAGKEYHTLLKERQIHPVSREILHIDFMVIPAHQLIDVDVPLKYIGTPVGVKEGGTMDIVHRTLHIQCLEEEIPQDIEVDVSNLGVGEALHVSQLAVAKWKVKEHPETALVTIHAKKVEQPTEPVAETKTEAPAEEK